MSAAEKLERLEAAIISAVHCDDATGQVMTEAEATAQPLIDAVPEIIAVLKIAEKVDGSHVRRELEAALSALDEKLGDVT